MTLIVFVCCRSQRSGTATGSKAVVEECNSILLSEFDKARDPQHQAGKYEDERPPQGCCGWLHNIKMFTFLACMGTVISGKFDTGMQVAALL